MRLRLTAFAALLLAACASASPRPPDPPGTVNDITQLNPIAVERIATPTSVDEISRLVAAHPGPISIGGGRNSQGGQTACTGCLFLDMARMNHILALDASSKIITVEAGVTWRQIQEAADAHGLSPRIMQSYSNFTVGGSISVNCHGDYVGLGPLVSSVRSLKLILADGSIVTASRTENPDLFRAAVGGYGGIGVIAEATLDLADNTKLERVIERMPAKDYPAWFARHITGSNTAILHYALLYPPGLEHVSTITSSLTDKPLTIEDRFAPQKRPTDFQLSLLAFVSSNPLGKFFREQVYDRMTGGNHAVAMRNYEQADDTISLEPASRAKSTYVLQEYFVPVEAYDRFIPRMAAILKAHKVNVLNVAIRHAHADEETLLSWAPRTSWAFVLYYEQGTDEAAKTKVAAWTRELIDAAIAEGGAYYLPYQIHATPDQFARAYPHAADFFAVKKRVDPTYKFRNRLWEAYYPAG